MGCSATSSLFPTTSSSTMSSTTTTTPKTPTRMLTKNPNGLYRWQGAVSACHNRYHSPVFGSPSSGNKIKLPPAEVAKNKSKRRCVGWDSEPLFPQETSTRWLLLKRSKMKSFHHRRSTRRLELPWSLQSLRLMISLPLHCCSFAPWNLLNLGNRLSYRHLTFQASYNMTTCRFCQSIEAATPRLDCSWGSPYRL